MLSKQQLKQFKTQLLALQQTLINDNAISDEARAIVELDQSSVGRLSRMDAMQGQAMAQENERRRLITLKRIETTLSNINMDDYGYCVECDEAIAIKRLEFDPTATLCIDCANNQEPD